MCVLHCLESDCVCVLQSREALSRQSASLDSSVHTRTNGHDRNITVILAKHCIKLPDDGSLVIRNMLEHFKYL